MDEDIICLSDSETEDAEYPHTSRLEDNNKILDFLKKPPVGLTVNTKPRETPEIDDPEIMIIEPVQPSNESEKSESKMAARKPMSHLEPKNVKLETDSGEEQLDTHLSHSQAAPEDDPKGILRSAVKTFLHATKSRYENSTEADIVRSKFHKRIDGLIADPKTIKKLTFLVERKLHQFREKPLDLFPYIQEIFNEMDCNQQKGKRHLSSSTEPVVVSSASSPSRRQTTLARNLKRLEICLARTHRKIRRLEREEVNLDDLDSEESSYLKMSRLRAHFMRVYEKITKLKNVNPSLGRRRDKKIKIGEVSRIAEVNIEIEHFVNRKIKRNLIHKRKESIFPDFTDIVNIYEEAVRKRNLNYSKEMIMSDAKETFRIVGERLSQRRRLDEEDDLEGYASDEEVLRNDPANEDSELAKEISRSISLAKKKTDELIDEYARMQIEPCDDEGHSSDNDDEDSADDDNPDEVMFSSDEEN